MIQFGDSLAILPENMHPAVIRNLRSMIITVQFRKELHPFLQNQREKALYLQCYSYIQVKIIIHPVHIPFEE